MRLSTASLLLPFCFSSLALSQDASSSLLSFGTTLTSTSTITVTRTLVLASTTTIVTLSSLSALPSTTASRAPLGPIGFNSTTVAATGSGSRSTGMKTAQPTVAPSTFMGAAAPGKEAYTGTWSLVTVAMIVAGVGMGGL